MPVTCEGFVIGGGQWKSKTVGTAGLGASAHAEMVAWGTLPQSVAYLLVQNDYPCKDCHDFFTQKSLDGYAIIIKVTANVGAYSSDHFKNVQGTPILQGSVPCVIYYHNGAASYVTMSNVINNPLPEETRKAIKKGLASDPRTNPPVGFPQIPDFTDI